MRRQLGWGRHGRRWLAVLASALSAALLVGSSCEPRAQGETYRAVTDDARGLAPGAGVYIAGVAVGDVQEVTVRDGRALITFALAPASGATPTLYRDACIRIGTYGMSGDAHLSITQGRRDSGTLGAGSTINCAQSEPETSEAVASLTTILSDVAAGHGTLGRLVRDPALAQKLDDFLTNRCIPEVAQPPAPPGGSTGHPSETH